MLANESQLGFFYVNREEKEEEEKQQQQQPEWNRLKLIDVENEEQALDSVLSAHDFEIGRNSILMSGLYLAVVRDYQFSVYKLSNGELSNRFQVQVN